jgi:hypothetical protein
LEDCAVLEAEFFFSQDEITSIKRNGAGQRLGISGTCTHGCGTRGRWWLFLPRGSINGGDEAFGLVSLINGDAVTGNDEVEAKESRDNSKGMYCPMFLKDLDNEVIGSFICAHTEKVVSSTAKNNRSILEDAAVDRRISAIREKAKIIKNHRFHVFLPFETGINASLNKAVHGYGQFCDRMSAKERRDSRPPFGFSFSDIFNPGIINF